MYRSEFNEAISESRPGYGSLAGDAAVAPADKGGQVQGFRRGNFAFDARECRFQLQAGAVEIAVGLLEDADHGRFIPRPFEPDEVQPAGLDGATGKGGVRGPLQVYGAFSGPHGGAAGPGVLIPPKAAREGPLILDPR